MTARQMLKRIEAIEKSLKPKPGENGTLRFYKISAEDDFAEDQNLKKFDTIVWLPAKSDDYQPPIWNSLRIIEDEPDTETEPPEVFVKIIEKQNTQQNNEESQQRRGVWVERLNMKREIVSSSKL